MLVFIDESGDPGFKISRGSTRYFVIALVIFNETLDAEETALKIKKLRKKLGKTDKFEFKFNKCSKKFRIEFLQEIRNCDFRIRAIVVDKTKIRSENLKSKKELFFNYVLRQVLQNNNDTIRNAKIRLDGRGEREFRRQLTAYLRRYLNSQTRKIMKNLRFRDSKKDVLIQMADMIAGSIRRYFEHNTTDWDIYRKIIKHKEEDIWEFE